LKKKSTGFNFSFWLLLPAKKKKAATYLLLIGGSRKGMTYLHAGGEGGRHGAIVGPPLNIAIKEDWAKEIV
jgi:hypothetical protein